ncbi:interleukin-9 receptor-like isoform X4 [Rhineura floridana]|uniref:interleukin-9 receptor-like isoform X4 n=1 Tax=Rhineura floridana TaxID=261503 RepID=UPI002AC810B5|nr:interleukin-9 receptor-like isoform X4 [Rhineura floridana]
MGKGCRAACLVQIVLFPFFAADERQQPGVSTSNVRCLNNYGPQGRRMDCMWNHNQTMGEGLFYLNFTDLLTLYSNLICNLSASREAQDNFCCSVSSEEGEFTENDEYGVSLHASSPGNSQVYPVFAVYEPRLHIACDPPFDLQSKMSSSKCRMQWKKPEAYEDIFLDDFQWEIAFKAAKAPWEQAQTRILVSKETWVDIEGYEFKSGVDYIARIRCKTPDVNWHYRSHWSHWSATTKWTAPPGSWQQFDSHLLRSVLSPLLCLGALLALLLVLMIFWRSKGNGYANVPTPATYFQPLYRFHNGNFKRWAGLPEKDAGRKSGREAPAEVGEAISQLSCLAPPRAEAAAPPCSCCSPPDGQYVASQEVLLAVGAPSRTQPGPPARCGGGRRDGGAPGALAAAGPPSSSAAGVSGAGPPASIAPGRRARADLHSGHSA